jgi:tripartite-type tricarboxylate transporter receptor subunit TctC
VSSIWFSISGPAKLPAEITRKMNEEIQRGLKLQAVADRMRRDGLVQHNMSPEDFHKFILEEKETWAPVVKQVGLAVKK